MAYDELLDRSVSAAVGEWEGVGRKRMFGGVCHLVRGNMFAGVLGDALILRLGEEGAASALRLPGVTPFDATGRPMRGWVVVSPAALGGDEGLRGWLGRARAFAETLPPKERRGRARGSSG